MKINVFKLLGTFAVAITLVVAVSSCKKEENNSNGDSGGNPPAEIVEGALSGTFSVGSSRYVRFSQGNLQYTTTGSHAVAGGGTAPGTWRFAENQWDAIGLANRNISSTYDGWIDLFGWGTSGYHNSIDQYNTHYQPYSTSTSDGYGPSTFMTDYNLTGTSANYDWGVYNAISNGGNHPGIWRAVTKVEWDTLLNFRATVSGIRYAKGTVNGVQGLIIVPDDWSSSTYALNSANNSRVTFEANVIASAEWTILEDAGCVFLPAAGYRNNSSIDLLGSHGGYWSSTFGDGLSAHRLYFDSESAYAFGNVRRPFGYSVRLVTDVQ